jgi:phosphatidylglycerol lysyltransferase
VGPHGRPLETEGSGLAAVRHLVLRHGWNATSFQIVNPGIEHWFPPAGSIADSVVGFVRWRRVRVVAGAPVCAPDRMDEVVRAFERDATRCGERVCYFGAEERLRTSLAHHPPRATVVLGAQPAWNPACWPAMIGRRASVRAQLHRARNKGVEVEAWSAEMATAHPDLERCLSEWLATRGLPPLHFLVEPNTLHRLAGRRVFVARRRERVVAFLVASPIPRRAGWLIEQIVRGHDAPNGTAELLIDAAVRAVAEEGSSYMTLGLAPLSRHAPRAVDAEPRWLRLTLAWIRAHGRRFYNFDGLDAFKSKFDPERWEPVYAITPEAAFSPSTLYAVAGAFTGGSPLVLGIRAVARAAYQEARWLGARARRELTRAPATPTRPRDGATAARGR